MKLLIIGSKGFIGSNFVRFFRKQNWDVFEADVAVDYGNTFYYQIDAINSDYKDVFSRQHYDVCINCSGAASVPESLVNPVKDFQLNVRNLYFIMDAVRLIQPDCKIINISSAAVYGNPLNLPISESLNLNPISPYGFHKKIAEEICDYFLKVWQIRVCTLRVFSAYGEGLKKQLFWDLFNKVNASNNIELYGTGDESRDFIHVLDIARATKLVILNSSFKGEKINVANGEEILIKDAVNAFLRFVGFNGTVTFNGAKREGDPINWKADISILKSYGYVQNIDLSTGLKYYSDWIQNLN